MAKARRNDERQHNQRQLLSPEASSDFYEPWSCARGVSGHPVAGRDVGCAAPHNPKDRERASEGCEIGRRHLSFCHGVLTIRSSACPEQKGLDPAGAQRRAGVRSSRSGVRSIASRLHASCTRPTWPSTILLASTKWSAPSHHLPSCRWLQRHDGTGHAPRLMW